MNKGYIIILNVLLLAIISTLVIVGVVNPIISHLSSSQSFIESKKAFLLSNSATEEAVYRLKNSKALGASTLITLSTSTATITVTNTPTGKDITVTSPGNTFQRNIKVSLALGTGISFHYGIQSGLGGFLLQNSSSITGNVFSSGPITGSGNLIRGDVVSAGLTGSINGIHATGTAYAHNILNSTIDKDAYYVNKTNTIVDGISYPNSPDQGPVDLPISDAQIAEWEDLADDGGTVTCTSGKYIINSTVSIGPKKIPCDLEITGNPTVTIGGHIWVTGNITIQNTPTIKILSSLGSQSVAVIADNPSNQSESGIIQIKNSAVFQGSGSAGSFIFMISQNNSAETSGSNSAIDLDNSSSGIVAYAAHGLITLENS
ncbi:MAG: hypothetical protein Q7S72_00005, partial [Candidatus Taylorbacteria bacterium]|nr:hypothetical protein [Candidatus Taylorbacteria bacterium]